MNSHFERLQLDELKKISRLIAFQTVRELDRKDQIAALSSVGFQPKEIAGLIGTSANSVSVALHQARKRGRRA